MACEHVRVWHACSQGGKEVHPPVTGYKKKPLEDAVAQLAK